MAKRKLSSLSSGSYSDSPETIIDSLARRNSLSRVSSLGVSGSVSFVLVVMNTTGNDIGFYLSSRGLDFVYNDGGLLDTISSYIGVKGLVLLDSNAYLLSISVKEQLSRAVRFCPSSGLLLLDYIYQDSFVRYNFDYYQVERDNYYSYFYYLPLDILQESYDFLSSIDTPYIRDALYKLKLHFIGKGLLYAYRNKLSFCGIDFPQRLNVGGVDFLTVSGRVNGRFRLY